MSRTGKWSFFSEIWPGFAIPFFQRFKKKDLKYHTQSLVLILRTPLSHLQQAPVSPQASVGMETLLTWKSCRTLATQPSRLTSWRVEEEEKEHLLGKGFKVLWCAAGLACGGSAEMGTESLELRREARAEHTVKTTAGFQLCPLPVWIMLPSSIKEALEGCSVPGLYMNSLRLCVDLDGKA